MSRLFHMRERIHPFSVTAVNKAKREERVGAVRQALVRFLEIMRCGLVILLGPVMVISARQIKLARIRIECTSFVERRFRLDQLLRGVIPAHPVDGTVHDRELRPGKGKSWVDLHSLAKSSGGVL